MKILGFLFGLGCLVLIAWAIALLGALVFGRKRRQPHQRQEQQSVQLSQFRDRFGSSQQRQSQLAAGQQRGDRGQGLSV